MEPKLEFQALVTKLYFLSGNQFTSEKTSNTDSHYPNNLLFTYDVHRHMETSVT